MPSPIKCSEQMARKIQPEKNETMVISSKRNKPYHPPLHMNDQDLHVVNSHKHLRVITSDNGQWNDWWSFCHIT
jgi:hypothetical protein